MSLVHILYIGTRRNVLGLMCVMTVVLQKKVWQPTTAVEGWLRRQLIQYLNCLCRGALFSKYRNIKHRYAQPVLCMIMYIYPKEAYRCSVLWEEE